MWNGRQKRGVDNLGKRATGEGEGANRWIGNPDKKYTVVEKGQDRNKSQNQSQNH